ncbi:MAG: hemolysin family protein [Pseudomonadota bacterium]
MNGDDPEPGEQGRSDGIWARLRARFNKPSEHEDIAAAIESGDPDEADHLVETRRQMIERVVAFDQKTVTDIMAPRADIHAVEIKTPLEELVRLFAEVGQSRMPIYRDDLDDPIGMVHVKDVVSHMAQAQGALDTGGSILKDVRRDVLYVPPSMRVTDLLLKMQATRIHMALVIDEYGGTDGLLTIEDLVEEIVGDINDEHDEDDGPGIASAASGDGWDVDARVEIEAFAEETGFSLSIDEDEEIDTVGGFVVSFAGRVPQRGEVLLTDDGCDIEVIEADARKVRRLRVRPSTANSQAAE